MEERGEAWPIHDRSRIIGERATSSSALSRPCSGRGSTPHTVTVEQLAPVESLPRARISRDEGPGRCPSDQGRRSARRHRLRTRRAGKIPRPAFRLHSRGHRHHRAFRRGGKQAYRDGRTRSSASRSSTGTGETPYEDTNFDGGYTQHVTMNVADREGFFREAFRVLKPGAFFAVTEHGLGEAGDPHHPLPWSEDGSGRTEFLMRPSETVGIAWKPAGFTKRSIFAETGEKYLRGLPATLACWQRAGELPPFGTHILLGKTAPQKVRNAARQHRGASGRVRCRSFASGRSNGSKSKAIQRRGLNEPADAGMGQSD